MDKEKFTRAIIHIDGDSFFASCEISLNPKLKGLPVVTGEERGIATAMSKEAKALGVHRGMPVFQIRKLYPQVIICKSDYMNYSLFAERMYDIVRRYTPEVEEYSIDECFASFDVGLRPSSAECPQDQFLGPYKEAKIALNGGLEAIAGSIKEALNRELGMTFSLGLAPTKVLAKVASKWQKPDGFTVIYPNKIDEFLSEVQIGAIWGIGPQTSLHLQRHGIRTAQDFVERGEDWVHAIVTKPYVEIWHELRGTNALEIQSAPRDDYKSIQKTKTFTPPSKEKHFVFSELSKNVEAGCAKLRLNNLSSRRIYYFLKTQEFRYHKREIELSSALNTPNEILESIKKTFDEVYKPGTTYRASGVTMSELVDANLIQKDLFGSFNSNEAWDKVYDAIDSIDKRFGTHSMMLGSSLAAFKKSAPGKWQIEKIHNPLTGYKKRLEIPYMGEVT
ncbi:MAG: DNA polymerase IV [bacterium]|nr:DNA polymerase IV [bacterium]